VSSCATPVPTMGTDLMSLFFPPGEGSGTGAFLEQAGCGVDLLRLRDEGVRGVRRGRPTGGGRGIWRTW
jgi:hypothetical protein